MFIYKAHFRLTVIQRAIKTRCTLVKLKTETINIRKLLKKKPPPVVVNTAKQKCYTVRERMFYNKTSRRKTYNLA